jgi:hypothetical protein
MKIYPNKKPANYSFEREKTRYQCATFHNKIRPRENNLILIPSGQTNKNYCSLGNTISLCITYQILITPLVSSNSSYPIIIDVMSYKGQKDYKSCKVKKLHDNAAAETKERENLLVAINLIKINNFRSLSFYTQTTSH